MSSYKLAINVPASEPITQAEGVLCAKRAGFDGVFIDWSYSSYKINDFIDAVKRENMTLVCTLLNCPTTYERTAQLIDDAFESYEYKPVLSENEVFTLGEGKERIEAQVRSGFSYPLMEEETQFIERKTLANFSSLKKRKKGEIVGQIQIYLAKQLLFSTNLYKL